MDIFHVSHNSGLVHVPELTTNQENKLMDLLNDTSKVSFQHSDAKIENSTGTIWLLLLLQWQVH